MFCISTTLLTCTYTYGAAGGVIVAESILATKSAFTVLAIIVLASGFMAGNNKTSLIFALFVKNIVNLSIPNPQPAVGGNACSNAVTKPSSHP